MSIILIVLILSIAVTSTLFFQSISFAATNISTVTVNVSSVGQISVTPAILDFVQVSPGGTSTDQTVSIQNIGSTHFAAGLYASINSFSEATNPLFGAIAGYQSGDFLVLKNSSDNVYHFVDRMEWNDSSIRASIQNGDGAGVSYGFFRNKTDTWLWEIIKDNNGECLNTSAGLGGNSCKIRMKTAKFTGIAGSYDMASGTTNASGQANTTEWSTWTFTAGPLVDYCVAIRKNCQALMLYYWDKNTTYPTCAKTQYINETLSIGATIAITANVQVPSGSPSGNATSSTLTITAS